LDDPEVVRFTRVPDPAPADFFDTWFARYEDGRANGTREAFAIVDDERTILGVALAPAIDRETATVELGYVIQAAARGRGIASRALALLTEWAFESLEAERIELYISPENEGSKRVAAKNGYMYEGTLRSMQFKQDVRADTEIWSKLSTDR
jgi:RimJ/RimL family protein N-acetyltransferase